MNYLLVFATKKQILIILPLPLTNFNEIKNTTSSWKFIAETIYLYKFALTVVFEKNVLMNYFCESFGCNCSIYLWTVWLNVRICDKRSECLTECLNMWQMFVKMCAVSKLQDWTEFCDFIYSIYREYLFIYSCLWDLNMRVSGDIDSEISVNWSRKISLEI